ncbi:nitrate reductase [Rhodothermus profundi]|uniref:Ferredoxin-nitrate reductase n=1 Tax=Rhodothermus profundi TaxID=633813 RepID=A0A1M6R9F8_9BACT|nr:nitrate reductase [Rhodothermus profundi]SHK29091.1 ferredoxin-nitrate reductase [Rhodothermus profundi]
MATPASIKTTCCYCGVGCGIEIRRDRQGHLTLSGDPDHPANRGQLCSKGRYLLQVALDHDDRLLYPMVRPHRNAPLTRTNWDAALDHIAATFRRIIERHGPDAIGFYVSGQLLTEEYYVATKLVKGFLGTHNIDSNSRLCMSSAVAGYKLTLGDDAPPICYDDIEHSQCILIAGANPAWCHPILFRRIEAHRAANPDVRLIVVDPRRTQSAAVADLHLQIRPGTDIVLYNALAAYLIHHGYVDFDFITNHTEGFEALCNHLKNASLERAARLCDVPLEDLQQAAEWIGQSPALLTLWAMGLNQSTAGVANNLALINLSLLKGQIGRPGMGPFSLTGQPNAMGGREVGAMANLLPAHRDLNNPDHRAEVAAFWGVPSLSDRPGLTATEMIDALEKGRLKAIWIIGTNPALSQPELARLERAFARAELVVVQEISTRAATLQWADVVLPAASWLEKQGTMTNSERRITYLPRLLDPPGEARPDVWILCDFARRMGWGHAFSYQDESEIFNEYARLTRGTPIDISGVSYERLQRERSIQWPCPAPDHPGTPRLFTNHRFLTPSGRARLHPVPEPAPPEPPSPEFPFILTTGRVRDQWHTRTKTGKVARLNQHAPEPFLEMHPDDAAACGLSEGALAEVTGRTGKLTVRVHLTPTIKRGVVFLPMHWGQEAETADGRVNVLIPCRIDPISRQPALKFARVQVAPLRRQRQRIVIIGAGAAARAFLEAYRKHNDTDELYLFGREPHGFYNRVQLPEYLSGQRTVAQLRTLADAQLNALRVHFFRGVEVINVDRTARVVHGSNGVSLPYDRLVLATGSRPFIPPGIPITWPNVFTLRTLADADAIRTRLAGSQRVLILGGGLLGLEVAAALHEAGYTCTILELADRLMARQLDETAAALLREELEARGIRIYCNDAPETFLGTDCFEGVRTRTGRTLTADLLLVAVGTRPETRLATRIGLNVHRGVCVNDHLQTSDPAIYAIGEVAEHRGQLYGTTPAAEEQARVAAAHIAGDVWARYSGSVPFNILKIPDFDLCALGQSVVPPDAPAYEEVVLLDRKRRIYQKVVVRHNRLVGAILLGDRSAFAQFQRLIAEGLELDAPPHRLLQGSETAEPPEGPIVCSCYNVGRGNLERAIAEGCTELDDLCRRTRAGTGCGSCRPELQMLLEARRHRTPVAA